MSFSVSALMRIVLLGRCTPMWLRIPPPCSTCTRTFSPSIAVDAKHEAPVVEEDAVVDAHVAREPLVVDRDDALVGAVLPLDERGVATPRGQVERRGKLPVRIFGPHRSCSAATAFFFSSLAWRRRCEARAVLLVRAVGEVEPRDVHSGVDERPSAPRASRRRGRAYRRASRGGWPWRRAVCHLRLALCRVFAA